MLQFELILCAVISPPREATIENEMAYALRVPNGVPIVTVKPSDRSLMIPGAKVIVTQQVRDGQAVATRAVVGRNGFAPPM